MKIAMQKKRRIESSGMGAVRMAALLLLLWPAGSAAAQATMVERPEEGLAQVLVAACRQEDAAFAARLTEENAEEFRRLSPALQKALMRRFVLVEDAGRPLRSNDADGRMIVRCETPAVTSVMRFRAVRLRENLAFITVEVNRQREAEFGMVREGGSWKVLSLGLLLLNLRELAQQWNSPAQQPDRPAEPPAEASEQTQAEEAAIKNLLAAVRAVIRYQEVFKKLPDRLEQLGPSGREGVSPERAQLLDYQLAEGRKGGYRFTYTPQPLSSESAEPRFQLTATPIEYGKPGRRSFYMEADLKLRGGDKQGAVATADDPLIEP
jgi:hypothetical protein